MKTIAKKLKEMTPERRARISKRSQQLIAEELTLRELRKAHKLTQATIARNLNMTQDNVSRLEKRSDTLISTLSRYVEAAGGTLKLVAEFPDRKPVAIAGLGDIPVEEKKSQPKPRTRSASR